MLSRRNSADQESGESAEAQSTAPSLHASFLNRAFVPSPEELETLFEQVKGDEPEGRFSQITEPGFNGARTLVVHERFSEELPHNLGTNKSTHLFLEQQIGNEIAVLDYQINTPAFGSPQITGALTVLNREPNDAYLMNAEFQLAPGEEDDPNREVNIRGWDLREAFISGGWEAVREELSDTARYSWNENSMLQIYDTDTPPLRITGPESTEWDVVSAGDDPKSALQSFAENLHQLSESIGSMYRVQGDVEFNPDDADFNDEQEGQELTARAGGIYLDRAVTCGMVELKIPLSGSEQTVQLQLHFELPTDPLHEGLMYLTRVDVQGAKVGWQREIYTCRDLQEEVPLNQNAHPSPALREILEALHEYSSSSDRPSLAQSDIFSSISEFQFRPASVLAHLNTTFQQGWAGRLLNWYSRR